MIECACIPESGRRQAGRQGQDLEGHGEGGVQLECGGGARQSLYGDSLLARSTDVIDTGERPRRTPVDKKGCGDLQRLDVGRLISLVRGKAANKAQPAQLSDDDEPGV